jgi:hypothetical protein
MRKPIALLLAGLAAGFAIAAWWGGTRAPASRADEELTTEQRLGALEAELAAETRRRQQIEAELAELNERIGASATSSADDGARADELAPAARSSASTVVAPSAEATSAGVDRLARRRPPFELDDDELIERFVAAGIAPDRAQWIVERSQELRMEALQAQYDAAREGRPLDASLAALSPGGALRAELGDADYERYLQALDRPTSVYVRDVIASSPGDAAGLKPGDQVVAFDGERVFDMSDVNRLVLDGEPGQMVAVDVLRDGQLVQLYVARGPIGITGGRIGPAFR